MTGSSPARRPGSSSDKADPDAVCSWKLSAPLDVGRTLIGGHGPLEQPTTVHRPEGVWRATTHETGPASLLLRRDGDRLSVHAWGPGAQAVVSEVPGLVGLEDEPGVLRAQHEIVRTLQRRFPGIRLGRGRSMLEVLVPVVLAQRVTHHEARRAYVRLVDTLGEPAPGPCEALRLPPRRERLLSMPAFALRRLGIGERTAETIRELARCAPALGRLSPRDPKSAYERLCSIPGVGPWTAAIATARGLGWADAVPWGDFHLPSAVSWALAGEPRGEDQRMQALLEPYSGQRWRVVQLLAAANVHAPRRGPRSPWRMRHR